MSTSRSTQKYLCFSRRGMLYAITLMSAGIATYGGVVGLLIVAFLMVPHVLHWRSPNQRRANLVIVTIVITILGSWLSDPLRFTAMEAIRAANRSGSNVDIMHIALSILNYRDANGHFPPPYTTDEAGQKLHSWRTLILPFIEEAALYEQIRLDEPYDSPANRAVLEGVKVNVMRSRQPFSQSRSPSEASYLAIVGDRTMWPTDIAATKVPDGEEGTILLVEVASSGIDWFEPKDLTVDEAVTVLTASADQSLTWTYDGLFTTKIVSTRRLVMTAAGSRKVLNPVVSRDDALAMLTRDGGEQAFDIYDVQQQPSFVKRVLRWDRIGAALLLFGLALLPAFKTTRRWALGNPS